MNQRSIALVLIAPLMLSTVASAEPGLTDKKIVFAACSVYSGPIKDVGEDELAGAKAYLDYINKEKGGVHGRQIEIEHFDDQYDPAKAVECFNRLTQADVFAGAFFAGAKPAAKYVEMARIHKFPIFGIATGADFLFHPVNRYLLSVRATYNEEVADEIEHLWNDVGYRKYGVIFQNDALGAGGLTGVQAALKKHGAEPVALGSFATNSLDVDSAIEPVRAAKPEVVFLVGTYFSTAEIVKKARAANWNPLFVTTPGREEFMAHAGAAANGVVYAILFPPPMDASRKAVALFDRNMKKYGSRAANIKTEEGYVHAVILVEALKRAGKNVTRENLIDAFETMRDVDFGFGSGFSVSFTPENHQGFNHVIFTVVRAGKAVPFTDWKSVVPAN